MLDSLTVFWEKLIENVALSLNGKPKRLNEGRNETDDNAEGNRDGGSGSLNEGGRQHGPRDHPKASPGQSMADT